MLKSDSFIKKVKVEDLEISTITEKIYDYSNRESEIRSLEQSIQEIGQREPIIVISKGDKFIIIDGVLRFYALKNLNFNEVDCIGVDFEPTPEFTLVDFIIHHQIRKEKTPKEKENEIRELLRIGQPKKGQPRDREERRQLVSDLLGKGWGRNNVIWLCDVMEWEDKTDHNLNLTERLLKNDVKMNRVRESIEMIDSNDITKEMEEESQVIGKFIEGDYDKSKALTLIDSYKSRKKEKPTVIELHPIKKENFKIIKGNIEDVELPEDLLIDTIFTSPAYYRLIKYGNDPNELGWEKNPDEYVKRLSDILMKCFDKLKETGNMFVNLGETYKDKQCLGIIDRLTVEMMNRGVRLVDKIIWNKEFSGKPVGRSVQRFYPGYEVILHFSKSRDYYFDNFKIQRDKRLRVTKGCKEKGLKERNHHIPNPHGYFRNVIDPETLTNVITLQIGKNRTKHVEGEDYHPATFSMDLPLLPLLVSVPKSENSVVFDPFMGSGSCGVTALKLGFKFVGCELYENNIKTARRMMSENQQDFDQSHIDNVINKVIFGDDESESQAA